MRKLHRVATSLALAVVLAAGLGLVASRTRAETSQYVCPPCGAACDTLVFDHPGVCPQCGMTLIEKSSSAARAAGRTSGRVGILIFNACEIIDYTGPWEVFGAAGYDVYTVAATRDPITTAMGMTVVPKYTFADAPQPDILLVPGGGVKTASSNPATLAWVKATTAGAQHTLSVCNGAFILASAGLLDGLSATTTAGNLDRLKDGYPKIRVVYDQRYVDNGKIITAGGLTAGIDGALHVVDRMLGRGTAEQVALGEEYEWHPQGGFARATMADRIIPSFHDDDLPVVPGDEWNTVRTEGDRDRWEMAFQGPARITAAELATRIGAILASRGKWVAVQDEAAASASPTTSHWKMADREGKPWTGTMSVAPAGAANHYVVTIRVARAS
jgi:putative intracellular protease/amidase